MTDFIASRAQLPLNNVTSAATAPGDAKPKWADARAQNVQANAQQTVDALSQGLSSNDEVERVLAPLAAVDDYKLSQGTIDRSYENVAIELNNQAKFTLPEADVQAGKMSHQVVYGDAWDDMVSGMLALNAYYDPTHYTFTENPND